MQDQDQYQLYKLLVLVAVLFGLLFVAIQLSGRPLNSNNATNVTKNTEKSKNITTEVPSDQLPQGLPSNLPIEKDVQITNNTTTRTPEGTFSSTRTYLSTKSLAENYSIFANYFKSNKWEIISDIDNPDYKFLAAQQGYKTILVNLNLTPQSEKTTVSVSYTE